MKILLFFFFLLSFGIFGTSCQKTLSDGVPLIDYVPVSEWRYFFFSAEEPGILSWEVNRSSHSMGGESMDCTLFISENRVPTLRDEGENGSQNTQVKTTQTTGSFYAGVFGFSACRFAISVTLETPFCGKKPLCSGRGSCHGRSCFCFNGFSGDFCEIHPPTPILSSGKMSEQITLPPAHPSWKYFQISTPGLVNQTWYLHQWSSHRLCSLYIRFGDYPTTRLTDFWDSIQHEENFLVVQFPESGETYAGVNGESCTFDISVTFSECPNATLPPPDQGNCSIGGLCVCTEGFRGACCEIREIFPKNKAEGIGSSSSSFFQGFLQNDTKDSFFFVGDESWDRVDWIVQERSGNCQIAWSLVPNSNSWEILLEKDLIINQTKVVPGENYYVTIQSAAALQEGENPSCLYSLNLAGVSWGKCPSFCNFHGTCPPSKSGTLCHCQRGYEGDACEEYSQEFPIEKTMRGYTSQSSWSYYHLSVGDVSKGLSVSIKLNQEKTGFVGNCDLLVRANAKPTPFKYDYSTFNSTGELREFVIPEPSGEKWYFGIFGWSDCEYELSANCDCPGHSNCVAIGLSFSCVCEEGWGGPDCLYPMSTVTPGAPLFGLSVSEGKWSYYLVPVKDMTGFSLVLKQHGEGELTVVIAFGRIPTLQNFDDVNWTDENQKSLRFVLTYNPPTTGEVYIGIYTRSGEVQFDLNVWVGTA